VNKSRQRDAVQYYTGDACAAIEMMFPWMLSNIDYPRPEEKA